MLHPLRIGSKVSAAMMVAANATRVAIHVPKYRPAMLASRIEVTGVNAFVIVRPLGLAQDAPNKSVSVSLPKPHETLKVLGNFIDRFCLCVPAVDRKATVSLQKRLD